MPKKCTGIKNLDTNQWLIGWNYATNEPVWGNVEFALCLTQQQIDDFLVFIFAKGGKGDGAIVPDRGF